MPEISQLGASGAVVVVVFIFLKYMREEASKRDRQYALFNKTIKANTTYLRDRNGRDSQVHEKLITEIKTISKEIHEVADRNLNAYKNINQDIKQQHVTSQVVEKAVVKKKAR